MDITTKLLRAFLKEFSENPTPVTRFEEIKPDPRRWIFRDLGLEGKMLGKFIFPNETIHASGRNFGLMWGQYLPQKHYSEIYSRTYSGITEPEIFSKAYVDLNSAGKIPLEDLNEYKKQQIDETKKYYEEARQGVQQRIQSGSSINRSEDDQLLLTLKSEELRAIEFTCYQHPKIIIVAVISREDDLPADDISIYKHNLMHFSSEVISKELVREIKKTKVDYFPETFGPHKVLQEFLTKFSFKGENENFYLCSPEITMILCTTTIGHSGVVKIQEVKHILQWDAQLKQIKPEGIMPPQVDFYVPTGNTARPVENEDLMKKELQAIIDAHNNASISKQLNEPKAESPFVQEKSSSM